jgi:hypothetical protein
MSFGNIETVSNPFGGDRRTTSTSRPPTTVPKKKCYLKTDMYVVWSVKKFFQGPFEEGTLYADDPTGFTITMNGYRTRQCVCKLPSEIDPYDPDGWDHNSGYPVKYNPNWDHGGPEQEREIGGGEQSPEYKHNSDEYISGDDGVLDGYDGGGRTGELLVGGWVDPNTGKPVIGQKPKFACTKYKLAGTCCPPKRYDQGGVTYTEGCAGFKQEDISKSINVSFPPRVPQDVKNEDIWDTLSKDSDPHLL